MAQLHTSCTSMFSNWSVPMQWYQHTNGPRIYTYDGCYTFYRRNGDFRFGVICARNWHCVPLFKRACNCCKCTEKQEMVILVLVAMQNCDPNGAVTTGTRNMQYYLPFLDGHPLTFPCLSSLLQENQRQHWLCAIFCFLSKCFLRSLDEVHKAVTCSVVESLANWINCAKIQF